MMRLACQQQVAAVALTLLATAAVCAAVCGDGYCDETCHSCPGDCGPCQPRGAVRACRDPHTFALTFDDGPDTPTNRLLDILSQQGVKASFFVIGRQVPGMASTVARAQREGHFIASHTYNHPYLTGLPAASIRQEMLSTEAAVRAATCVRTKLMRPPYGATNSFVDGVLYDIGYIPVLWNVDSQDWQAGSDAIYWHVMNGLSQNNPGSVIHLQHDRIAHSVEVVPRLISAIRGYGYRFVTLDECVYGPAGSASLDFQVGDCPPVCGDGRCTGTETCSSCATDCGSCPFICGDGVCHNGEVCPTDCDSGGGGGGGSGGPVSSTGTCGDNHPEGLGCPQGQCCSPYGWCGSSSAHCTGGSGGSGGFCGDGQCLGTEDCDWCPTDCSCGPECGDLTCDASEDCSSCAYDCGPCVPPPPDDVCGDNLCTGDETCDTCADDCGPCQPEGIATHCVNDDDYALTFDDGPTDVTPRLLDILAEKGAHASFFMPAQQVLVPGMDAIVQRIQDEGHWIGNHGYDQVGFNDMTLEELRTRMVDADTALQASTCFRPRLVRPPLGELSSTRRALLESMGYKAVTWSFDAQDYGGADAATILARVSARLTSAAPGESIIHVQHDRSSVSVETVGAIIDMVRGAGKRLVTLDECMYGRSVSALRDFQIQDCPGAYCGDFLCEADGGETCQTCELDCGACKTCGGDTGGGDTGGGDTGGGDGGDTGGGDTGGGDTGGGDTGGGDTGGGDTGGGDTGGGDTGGGDTGGGDTGGDNRPVSTDGTCGSNHAENAVCPTGSCCSQYGWCGSGVAYCGAVLRTTADCPDTGGGNDDAGGNNDGGAGNDDGGAGNDDGGAGNDDPPAPYCGDGTCSAAAGETCETCEDDCGACPPPSGECTGCWYGSSGPCMVVHTTACFNFMPSTTTCPPGTVACATLPAASLGADLSGPALVVAMDVALQDGGNLTRSGWSTARTDAVASALAAHVDGANPGEVRLRVVALEDVPPALREDGGDEPRDDALRVQVSMELAADVEPRVASQAAQSISAALASPAFAGSLSAGLGLGVDVSQASPVELALPSALASSASGDATDGDGATGWRHHAGASLSSSPDGDDGDSTLPAWLLPAGVAAGAVALVVAGLLVRRRRGAGGRARSRSGAGHGHGSATPSSWRVEMRRAGRDSLGKSAAPEGSWASMAAERD